MEAISSDEDMDFTAASWETVPDESEVLWNLQVQKDAVFWKDVQTSVIVDYFLPTYLKEWGFTLPHCFNYSVCYEPDFDESNWVISKYISNKMLRREFCIGFNESVEQCNFEDWRLHGNVGKAGERLFCGDCVKKEHGVEIVEFHAWYNDEDIFTGDVSKYIHTFFCCKCNIFLYELSDNIDCVICDNIVELNGDCCYSSVTTNE